MNEFSWIELNAIRFEGIVQQIGIREGRNGRNDSKGRKSTELLVSFVQELQILWFSGCRSNCASYVKGKESVT
jgi:hypothetical protein